MPANDEVSRGYAFKGLFRRIMLFLALMVIARFVMDVLGAPLTVSRLFSSTAGLMLAAMYLAAVGPLKGGMSKFPQLVLAALLMSVWTVAWVILATFVSGVFRVTRSHFAGPEDYGSLGRLGHHILNHSISTIAYFVIALLLMTIVHVLWRWPVTVGPGVMLGALVVVRYWLEAMGLPLTRTAAWSSTVGILIAAIYLGGVGPRLGLSRGRQLFVPALVLGWTWRAWVFVAILISALVPYRTHFFDPTLGDVPLRLARALAGTVVEGFIAGLLGWGIAAWIASATREAAD